MAAFLFIGVVQQLEASPEQQNGSYDHDSKKDQIQGIFQGYIPLYSHYINIIYFNSVEGEKNASFGRQM